MAQWILVIIAICGLIYNTIVTHITLKNDVKHLQEENTREHDEIKKDIRELRECLLGK